MGREGVQKCEEDGQRVTRPPHRGTPARDSKGGHTKKKKTAIKEMFSNVDKARGPKLMRTILLDWLGEALDKMHFLRCPCSVEHFGFPVAETVHWNA